MFIIKKKIPNYLYIFFVFLAANFSEFSTNKAAAKNFVVSNIQLEEKYNLNFNKLNVIDRGFKLAFEKLSRTILEKKDFKKIKDTSIEDVKKLIDNFSILDEKFISQKYNSVMEVQFNRKKIIKFFNSKNIISSLPKNIDVFFLPVFVDTESKSLSYLNDNVFVEHWDNVKKNYFQINYILPNEDVEDYVLIKRNLKNIENYNFYEILKKYNLRNYIIMIIFKKKEGLVFYSKVKFDNKFYVLNENISNDNIENDKLLHSLIFKIKNKYEDKWKLINKINPSASVPISLSLEASNIKQSLKLENALSNLDFVSNYEIERFNNNEIIYKINYNSSPKRFLKEIVAFDIKVDTSLSKWKIK